MHLNPRVGKPVSVLSGTFSTASGDCVSHWFSGRASADKINVRPKANWKIQAVEGKAIVPKSMRSNKTIRGTEERIKES